MNNSLDLKEVAFKYYNDMEAIVNDLASRCLGDSEVSFNYPAGKVTIKIK